MIFHANISFNDNLDKLSKTYWRDSRFSWGMILSVPSLGYADEGSVVYQGERDEDLDTNGELFGYCWYEK